MPIFIICIKHQRKETPTKSVSIGRWATMSQNSFNAPWQVLETLLEGCNTILLKINIIIRGFVDGGKAVSGATSKSPVSVRLG